MVACICKIRAYRILGVAHLNFCDQLLQGNSMFRYVLGAAHGHCMLGGNANAFSVSSLGQYIGRHEVPFGATTGLSRISLIEVSSGYFFLIFNAPYYKVR